jgi:hypothetical protein
MEKGKGAQGLGRGVALVETEEKESCDLRSYWLIHSMNSILSQDILTILFLKTCGFHLLVIAFPLYSEVECVVFTYWMLPQMQRMARARMLHPRVLCTASEAIPSSCESVRIRCHQRLTAGSSSFVLQSSSPGPEKGCRT